VTFSLIFSCHVELDGRDSQINGGIHIKDYTRELFSQAIYWLGLRG